MNRYTVVTEKGAACFGSSVEVTWDEVEGDGGDTGILEKFTGDAIEKLARYEDTGLTPEQVRKIKESMEACVGLPKA